MRNTVALIVSLMLLFPFAAPVTSSCEDTPEKSFPLPADVPVGEELYAACEDKTAADAIASLYDIELVSFSWGIAVFHTEEDPLEVIARGEENGWPPIAVNRTETLFEGE